MNRVIGNSPLGAGGLASYHFHYRFFDPVIGSAPAEIARHRFVDLLFCGLLIGIEQPNHSHDLTALAITALRHANFFPCFLYRMRAIFAQAFDRGDLCIADFLHFELATAGGLSIEEDGACAATVDPAAEFGAGKIEYVTQHPEQWHISIRFGGEGLAVNV